MRIKDWTWAFFGLLALAVRLLAGQYPEATDQFYSRTFFPGIRNLIDHSLGNLPFPTVYVFLVLVLGLSWISFRRFFRLVGWRHRAGYALQATSNGLGALVFFFLVLWGFNYQRTPIFQQLNLQPKPLNQQQLTVEMEYTLRLASMDRGRISQDTLALTELMEYSNLEDLVRATMQENLEVLGLNFTGRPRTKQFPPQGFMRRMGILGIYFPFSGESYLDPSLHALEKPFTIAHEMAHSYGFTDEGEANFIAWVVFMHAEEPLLRYAAHLLLLRYQLRDYYRMDPDAALCWMENLPRGIIQDLISIRESAEAYPPIWLALSRKSNDLFLKSQGVKAGIKSYQQLPMLASAWRQRMNLKK
ncbi:MAG: DUF3810 domain-containing protein [Bacteroidetes bacterium]|nr:DUF3810 domain-containing protein [Bacteroidota bacterium]